MTLEYASAKLPTSTPPQYPLLRCGLIYGGVGLPVAGLVLNLEPGESTVPVDWQNGQPLAWLTLVTLPGVVVFLLPFLLIGWAGLLAAAAAPLRLGRTWPVRAGLLTGGLMGGVFTLIVAAGQADGEVDRIGFSLAFQILGGAIAAAFALWLLYLLDFGISGRYGWRFGKVAATLFLILIVVGVLTQGMLLLLVAISAMFAAPCSVVCFGGALAVTRRMTADEPDPPWRPAWLAFGLIVGLHALSWLLIRPAALAEYRKLPTAPPDYCFVATAASRSRRSAAAGHRQLATLRAYERRMRREHPTTHARLRRVYNRVGPRLAARLTTPRRATAAYLLLAPLAWVTGGGRSSGGGGGGSRG